MFVKTNFYAGSLDEAYDCICMLGLTQCDPIPESLWAYEFPDNAALIGFVLDYGTERWVQGNTLIVPDSRKNDADGVIQRLTIWGVRTIEVFALEIWGDGDEAVFDALFA